MEPYWNDYLVRRSAVEAIYERLDTIASPEDLEIRQPVVRFFRRFVFVEYPEFHDFYLKVFVDHNGFPTKTKIHTYG